MPDTLRCAVARYSLQANSEKLVCSASVHGKETSSIVVPVERVNATYRRIQRVWGLSESALVNTHTKLRVDVLCVCVDVFCVFVYMCVGGGSGFYKF